MNHFKKDAIKFWFAKNSMLIGNAVSNLIGIQVIGIISYKSLAPPTTTVIHLIQAVDIFFIPLSFLAVFMVTIVYEHPIRKILNLNNIQNNTVPQDLLLKARRRLLNEPFALIAVDLCVWCFAAFVYPAVFYLNGVDIWIIARVITKICMTGMITTICAFFSLEAFLRKTLAPKLFPYGGLYATPKTFPIRIRTRLIALLLATNTLPCITTFILITFSHTVAIRPELKLDLMRSALLTNSAIFIFVGITVTTLVGRNLIQPFGEIISVLSHIRKGDLNQRVKVTTNDEIGYTGDVINEMTKGLKEREHMRQSLELAKKVQQNLLPKCFPVLPAVDIAGESIYCDQTGGDYFDFLEFSDPKKKAVGILVGDVCGHGISSALLMATGRAFLRLRSFMPGDIGRVVTDVNRQLSRDVADSGQFMTLFYLVVEPEQHTLRWVRAGHDPAIVYDAKTDKFETLSGRGIALGVDETFLYQENIKNGFSTDQIILIGTDGIWEARNRDGKMFGKAPIYNIIRKNAAATALQITNAIINALNQFQQGQSAEDDITLIVIKIGKNLT